MTGSDYPQYGAPTPSQPAPPPRKGNPPWMIWAIVGVVTVLVVGIVIAAIVNMGKDGGGTAGSAPQNTSDTQGSTPEDELRSHLPLNLRSAKECKPATADGGATAVIECVWTDSDVPNMAGYRLYEDTASTNADAQAFHQGKAQTAQSCASADDFTAGGQEIWTMNGQNRGTGWCYLNEDGQPVMVWTDDTLHILAYGSAPTINDSQQLLEWYRTEAGPM